MEGSSIGWAAPLVQITMGLLGAGGLTALLKYMVDKRKVEAEIEKLMSDREKQLTDSISNQAEDWRDLYFEERGRREELLDQLQEERARAARLEARLERIDTSLEQLSTSTGDWVLPKADPK